MVVGSHPFVWDSNPTRLFNQHRSLIPAQSTKTKAVQYAYKFGGIIFQGERVLINGAQKTKTTSTNMSFCTSQKYHHPILSDLKSYPSKHLARLKKKKKSIQVQFTSSQNVLKPRHPWFWMGHYVQEIVHRFKYNMGTNTT